ncbi:MAG TPA: IclR family transcriptional regulator [Devosiaceae bacterium]
MGEIDTSDRYRAPALDKGLDILELLATTVEGLSQAEIAKALDRSPNEIYRMLDRLVRRHYVSRTPEDRYELTLKLFALAHERPPIRRLVSLAMPVMRRLARAADQAFHIVVYDRGDLVVVAQADSPGYWSVSIRVGSRIGLLNTGSGHVLMAFASAAERALMLEEHEMLPEELAPPEFEERLNLVRAQGYEAMQSQQTEGVLNISVPILGPNGSVIAVLTSPYIRRLDTSRPPSPEQVVRLMLAASREISKPAGDLPS